MTATGALLDRSASVGRLGEAFDVIIIGGGATGLGAAVEASSRGLRVALLEASDFSKGTSSRSTKLVHGGVRYLAQGNIGLVREALRERGRLRKNAPHLVNDCEFLVPAYDWWSGPFYGVGMKIYDVLAGKLNLGVSKFVTRDTAVKRIPTIEPSGLKGGVIYHDGQFDDSRLAVTLAITAAKAGGVMLNYSPVVRLLHANGRTVGVVTRDEESGNEMEVRGKVVINATGVFAEAVRRMDDPDVRPVLSPSQGIHMVLPKEFLPGDTALMVPKTDDGRVLFAVPWHDRVVVGTTDTPVREASLEPRALDDEIEFLITHAARYLAKDPQPSDVLSVFAGLRPLVRAGDGGSTAALSRDHSIFVSKSGLITIVGGKWTTYRKMGEDVIDRASAQAGLTPKPSATAEMQLHGATSQPGAGHRRVYGSDDQQIRSLERMQPDLARPLHPRLPYTRGEVVWAARHEMARTLEDALGRRTRALVLDARASLEAAPAAASLMAAELGRDAAWEREQVRAYGELVAGYLLKGQPQLVAAD